MTKNLRLITFRVGPETFAADIMAVRQIVMYEGTTAVPTTPSFVEGVIVFRGEVVPVVDLRNRFFPKSDIPREQPFILIISTKAGSVGLKVDEVRTFVDITTDDLLPAPIIVRGVRGDYLVAIVERGNDVLLLLDLDAVLTDDEQRQLAEQPVS